MATLTLAICAHQAEDCIRTCLDSIRRQTVAPEEVVVCVHEFSDPTASIAASCGARVIASHGTGLFESRNAVLAACTTDYLAFTDADCVLVPDWVARVKAVLDARADVGAGTGRHPAIGPRTFAGWLHHMWFLVETRSTGETDGVIGGNSYFRTAALRGVGGWLNLPGHSNAEDVYISLALQQAGWKIWFEEGAAAQHRYEARFGNLMRKSVRMGQGIVVMMRAADWHGPLWWYTLSIPVMAVVFLIGLVMTPFNPLTGAAISSVPLVGSFLYLAWTFRSIRQALPRWCARWILIWPYAWGVVKGLVAPVPSPRS